MATLSAVFVAAAIAACQQYPAFSRWLEVATHEVDRALRLLCEAASEVDAQRPRAH